MLSFLLVTGCSDIRPTERGQRDIFAPLTEADFSPPPPESEELKPRSTGEVNTGPDAPRKQLFFGEAPQASYDGTVPSGQGAQLSAEGVQLNFDRADLAEVIRIILGDVLEEDYVLDPRVQGSVTISTSRPLDQEALLATLEMLLRMNGAALFKSDDLYRIIPAAEVAGQPMTPRLGGPDFQPDPGFGITVLPLEYVSPGTMIELLDSLVARPGALRGDAIRRILIVSGTAGERRAIIQAARSFDVDWLAGQSAGIFPLSFSSPEVIITELEGLLQAGPDGANAGQVQFQPIERLNAILVIAQRADLLRRADQWIERLDQANSYGTNLFVYYVENGKAEDLAGILNDIFAGQQTDSGTQQQRVAPGLDPQVSTAASREPEGGGDRGAATRGEVQSSSQIVGQISRPRPGPTADRAGGDLGGLESVGPIRVIADPVNNALLVLSTRAGYDVVRAALRQLDIRPLQVVIDATIAEVTLNDQLRFGVQWFLSGRDLGIATESSASFSAGDALTPSPTLPGFNFIINEGVQPRVVIDALSSLTNVKVLSSPTLVVLDNQPATLQVGDEVPVTTRTSTSITDPDAPVVNNIEFRDTGVILDVTPRINSTGLVTMEVEQEVSNVSQQVESGTLTPTISQRRVSSSIAVRSGQTVVLGGLIQEIQSSGSSGLPILRELPGIGPLFGTTDDSVTRTELIIFITPRVISDEYDAQAIAEELRDRLRGLKPPVPEPMVEPEAPATQGS